MNKRGAIKRSRISSHLAHRDWSRREFAQLAMAGTASAVALLPATSGWAETPAAIRVAFISPFVRPAGDQPSLMLDSFKAGLKALGWTESDTFLIESRFAAGQLQKIPDYVAELSRLGVRAFYDPQSSRRSQQRVYLYSGRRGASHLASGLDRYGWCDVNIWRQFGGTTNHRSRRRPSMFIL
jgi:hypothetical protein